MFNKILVFFALLICTVIASIVFIINMIIHYLQQPFASVEYMVLSVVFIMPFTMSVFYFFSKEKAR